LKVTSLCLNFNYRV